MKLIFKLAVVLTIIFNGILGNQIYALDHSNNIQPLDIYGEATKKSDNKRLY